MMESSQVVSKVVQTEAEMVALQECEEVDVWVEQLAVTSVEQMVQIPKVVEMVDKMVNQRVAWLVNKKEILSVGRKGQPMELIRVVPMVVNLVF